MKKKIAYIIFIVILLLLFIWTNKLQTLWLFGMFGIIWLPMFFINRYNAGKRWDDHRAGPHRVAADKE